MDDLIILNTFEKFVKFEIKKQVSFTGWHFCHPVGTLRVKEDHDKNSWLSRNLEKTFLISFQKRYLDSYFYDLRYFYEYDMRHS